ncbi:cilia and flagella associated protein [Aureococcus anophagefferens]|uniref:Cilia and flagella associated protein n=1 Tax=Aureococcus anophagefferens TaxID=44056 RepID=A0ABR1GAI1_AURAN
MVVIHVKFGQEDEFLYETTCATSNDELIRGLVKLNNTRVRIAFLCGALRELGTHGPAKPMGEVGIDHIQEEYEGEQPRKKIEKSKAYSEDPAGNRTGNGVGEQMQQVFEDVCNDGEAYISKQQAKLRKALTQEGMEDKLANMRGAVTMAYPMGLPKWDPVYAALEDGEHGLDGTQAESGLLEPGTAQLWCAGKEFVREETVGDRVGKNEKTKVVVKLQKPGHGAPAREPCVSEEERKAMMAHYFKRQEEMKALAEANDDDYLQSGWADTKALKNSLQGLNMNSVRAPGIR